MLIATFNCNSIRSRLGIVTHWIEKYQPDILALQEIKVETAEFPSAAFEELGYHCQVGGEKGQSGVATISKKVPDESDFGFGDGDEAEFSRIIRSRWGTLKVINTYVPQGRSMKLPTFKYKLEWYERLYKMFETKYSSKEPVIWLGDFNVAPEDIDVHNPKRMRGHPDFNPEVTAALYKIRDWGFTDLLRKFHPDETGIFTYWDYRVPSSLDRNLGWLVDHIYITKPLVSKATKCWIDKDARMMEQPSDHTFLVGEFKN